MKNIENVPMKCSSFTPEKKSSVYYMGMFSNYYVNQVFLGRVWHFVAVSIENVFNFDNILHLSYTRRDKT